MTISTSTEASVTDTGSAVADILIEEDNEQAGKSAEEEEQEETSEAADDESSEEEGDEEEPEEGEDDEDGEEASEEEEESQTTWGSALGVDDDKIVLDDDGNLKAVKVKVDGQEGDVDVNTLIAGFQTAKSNTHKSQALADERRQFEEVISQSLGTYKEKLTQAEDLIELLGKRLTGEYENTDWVRLRTENPGEYAAKVTEYQKRQGDLGNALQELHQTRQVTSEAEAAEMQRRKEVFVGDNIKQILQRFPEWSDETIAKEKFNAIRSFAADYGYSAEEFAEVIDHRAIAILHDAMEAKAKLNGAEAVAKKKVAKPVPKFRSTKTARKVSKKAGKVTKLDRLVKQAKAAKGSQKRAAQTDAIAELLMQQ